MDSELLLKFIGYFPDYLSALSRMLVLDYPGPRGFSHAGKNQEKPLGPG